MTQKQIALSAEVRTVLGKKVKQLRRQGILPANIFGSDMPSQAIQLNSKEFHKVYKEAGTTHVIYITYDKKEVPVLVATTHSDPLSGEMLHADFKKVNLRQKVEAEVPVELTGEHDLVKSGEADVLLVRDMVRVEALPTKIPESFTIKIATLEGIGSHIIVADLPKSEDYTIIDEPETVIVQLSEAKKEEAEPQESPSPDSVEATEEKPAEEGAENKEEAKKEE